MRTASIVIVHPSRLFGEGLQRILHGAKWKSAWFAELPEALPAKLARGASDLLFVVGAPSSADAVRCISAVREQFPGHRIVAIGNCTDIDAVIAALMAGACGYLQEAMSSEALPQALSLVMAGETIVPIELIRRLPTAALAQNTALDAGPSSTASATASVWTEVKAIDVPATNIAVTDADSYRSVSARWTAVGGEPTHLRLVPTVRADEASDAGAEPSAGETAATDVRGPVTAPAPSSGTNMPSVDITGDAPKTRVLSLREGEILQCLVRGDSNKEIARNLVMAEATVKVHLKTILRKIRVKNRTQAAIWAMNNPGSIASSVPPQAA